ncbi:putative Zinc finger, CCHC-type [Plasmopara halstedii]
MMGDKNRAMKHVGKAVVKTVSEPQKETRRCRNCKKLGHLKKNCPERSTGNDNSKLVKFALAAGSDVKAGNAKSWILDSDASRHLVNNSALLRNILEYYVEDTCMLPDGRTMDMAKKGSVIPQAIVDDVTSEEELSDVYYAPNWRRI